MVDERLSKINLGNWDMGNKKLRIYAGMKETFFQGMKKFEFHEDLFSWELFDKKGIIKKGNGRITIRQTKKMNIWVDENGKIILRKKRS